MKVIVTNTHSAVQTAVAMQDFLAETLFPFVERDGRSIKSLIKGNNADAAIVWSDTGPVLYYEETKFFFHPSMAKTRISNFRKFEQPDPLIKAALLNEDDDFLDCTMGLGADTVVASYFARQGRVVGIEYSPIVATVVKWGMYLYHSQMPWLDEAIKRINVKCADHLEYLKNLPDNSFDIVYFDPMFRKPVLKSQAISPLRKLANPAALQPESIAEARRVARKRVIMKEIYSSGEFSRLGFDVHESNPNNKIVYGIINID